MLANKLRFLISIVQISLYFLKQIKKCFFNFMNLQKMVETFAIKNKIILISLSILIFFQMI